MQIRRVMGWAVAVGMVVWLGNGAATATTQQTPPDGSPQLTEDAVRPARSVPAWAADARWYEVDVPRFHNGDRSNDPPGTLPWRPLSAEAAPNAAEAAAAAMDAKIYGGDLQGLQARLPYLKELGVNALYLTHLFPRTTSFRADATGWRHVDDNVGVKDGVSQAAGETIFDSKLKLSGSDRVFLEFVRAAHAQGFRIAVEITVAKEMNIYPILAIAGPWMDPNGDGDPSDGVDGWVVREPGAIPHEMWRVWRTIAKNSNPNVLLIVDGEGDLTPWLGGDEFDVAIDHAAGAMIRRFFGAGDAYPVERFLADLTAWAERQELGTRVAMPVAMSGVHGERWLSSFLKPVRGDSGGSDASPPRLDERARVRASLTMVCQFMLPGAPITYYGDEVGMVGGSGAFARAPMWWTDLSDPASKPDAYRADLAALQQWLNVRRSMEAPLRRGEFHPILVDEPSRIFAVARTLPDERVILVVNYGDGKQRVTLPVGRAGQLAAILNPQFGRFAPTSRRAATPEASAPSLIRPLWIGGSRQYVDTGGHIRFWIDPRTVRLIIVR